MEDTTFTIEADGITSGPFTMDDLDQAAARLEAGQLSFDVGLPGNRPDFACIKIGGSLPVPSDLKRRQEVTVMVLDEDGQVLAKSTATVTAISFKDKTDGYGTTTERIHTVSL